VVYLISPVIGDGNASPEKEVEYDVSAVHRPDTAHFIEEILIDKVVRMHRAFCLRNDTVQGNGSEVNWAVKEQDTSSLSSTARVTRTYLGIYNNATCKLKNKESIPASETDDTLYSNSPLRKTKENEKKIEKYRNRRKKSGKDYNQDDYTEEKNEDNTDDAEKEVEVEAINSLGSVSVPFFLVIVSISSAISYYVGRVLARRDQ
jgi:hypothetical protein